MKLIHNKFSFIMFFFILLLFGFKKLFGFSLEYDFELSHPTSHASGVALLPTRVAVLIQCDKFFGRLNTTFLWWESS